MFEESWVAVGDDTDRLPDLAVYLVGRGGRIPDRVPDMIFEIVSETRSDQRRDYDEKHEEYERIGVTEYVIVDRFRHTVTVLRLVDGEFNETVLGPDDVYSSPLLPGLRLPLKDVI